MGKRAESQAQRAAAGSLVVEMLDGVAAVPREDWNALVRDESPFLEWEWLASLEESGCVGASHGWQSKPLLLRDNGRLVGACPLYVKGHSEGEFVFDWAGPTRPSARVWTTTRSCWSGCPSPR